MASLAPSISSSFLGLPRSRIGVRFQKQRDELDEFLSSDFEMSFASTISLNSPPREPLILVHTDMSPVPMDISPAPSTAKQATFNFNRRRANTTVRAFGTELSNQFEPIPPPVPPKQSCSSQSGSKRLQRAALPSEWMSQFSEPKPNPTPAVVSPARSDAMDIDHVEPHKLEIAPLLPSPAPLSAAPTITTFSNLFFESTSPVLPKKRRSHSPSSARTRFESDRELDLDPSSPTMPSSPSQRKLERFSTAACPGELLKKRPQQLLGLGAPSDANASKRLRRPTFSALLPSEQQHSDAMFAHVVPRSKEELNHSLLPPRRAFSAMIAPGALGTFNAGHEDQSGDTSAEGTEMSSPAAMACAKRQSLKTIRRRDGTDDFRPLTGIPLIPNGVRIESPSAKYMSAGIPGFGDNEAFGKVLPCHRVTEDGLMRIDCKTLDALMDGKYGDKVAQYFIIDCRFDYEYNGGHIPGAININTTPEIEEFFLGQTASKPTPSCSGDNVKKTVLVFHCEFSAKRAPTFAKHLRSKDRAMNRHVYPRILYPEVYVLGGGYCQYYKESTNRCQPRGYVRMDDPAYINSRNEDMDQFRKARFGRTKSYAYGDNMSKTILSQGSNHVSSQPQRNSAPSGTGGVTSLFAAANAARTRRVAPAPSNALSTLQEDGNTTSVSDDEDESALGDSPCPPPSKANGNIKITARRTLTRAHTYDPTIRC